MIQLRKSLNIKEIELQLHIPTFAKIQVVNTILTQYCLGQFIIYQFLELDQYC